MFRLQLISSIFASSIFALPASAATTGDIQMPRKVPYAHPEDVTDAIRIECRLEQNMGMYLSGESDRIVLIDNPIPQGKILDLRITAATGRRGATTVEVQGTLIEAGKPVATVAARRNTVKGGFATCGRLDYAAQAVAEDIAEWLEEEPVANARLGDLE